MKKRVLVVDDEAGIGNILRIKLRLHGYDVVTTTSGADAIEIIRSKEPDIVLLDILMPGVTGADVLKEVRTFSQVPIIILTAKPDVTQFAMKLGANDAIAKPFDPDYLVEKVGSVLAKTKRQRPKD